MAGYCGLMRSSIVTVANELKADDMVLNKKMEKGACNFKMQIKGMFHLLDSSYQIITAIRVDVKDKQPQLPPCIIGLYQVLSLSPGELW